MKVMMVTKKYKYEPLGVAYLAAMLEKGGHKPMYATEENALDLLKEEKPDSVGFSVLTGSHNTMLGLAKKMKEIKPGTHTIFGGPHPTYFPRIFHEKAVDSVIVGEAEHSICDFVENQEHKCERGRLETDLDNLPFPNREFVYQGLPDERNNPILHVMGSRGCPFNCPYCYNEGFKEIYHDSQTVRYRSPKNIIEEIKEVNSGRPVKFIHFQDDAFTANKKWLNSFLEEYQRELGLPFHAIVRLDQLDEDTIIRMKKAGLHSVRTAVECADDKIRKDVLKRNMSKEKIIDTCRLLKKHNIEFLLQNLLGLPEGDLQTDLDTLEFNKQLNPTYAWASLFQPYPGTKLGDKHNGLLKNIEDNFYEGTPLAIRDKEARIELRKTFSQQVNGRTYADADKLLYAGLI